MPTIHNPSEIDQHQDGPVLSLYLQMVAFNDGKDYEEVFDRIIRLSGQNSHSLHHKRQQCNDHMLAAAVILYPKVTGVELKPLDVIPTLDPLPFLEVDNKIEDVMVPRRDQKRAIGNISIKNVNFHTLTGDATLDDQVKYFLNSHIS